MTARDLAGWGLAVDLGTSFTSACRFDRDGVVPLEVGGTRRIPSAVLLDRNGELAAGELAVRGGGVDPDRVERTPKRAVGRPFILLGGQHVVVSDALAALLDLVAGEATRQEGGLPPSSLVLTHPARWGTNRRANLSVAADRAGLPDPVLVPEPVAAAWRHLSARPAGTTVAVYDLGAGTFDTAVVRAEADGVLVLGEPGGEDDVGGETFDHAVFRLVLDHLDEREPGITTPLLDSDERRWKRAASDLLDEVRRAKEALSTTLRTSVYFPLLDAEVQVTRGELEDLIRPHVDSTVQELARTITAAGLSPGDLDAIHLVGGSSRIPLVAQMLRDRFGDLLQTYDDPKHVVVDGAAQLMRARRRGDLAAPLDDAELVDDGDEGVDSEPIVTQGLPPVSAAPTPDVSEASGQHEPTLVTSSGTAPSPGQRLPWRAVVDGLPGRSRLVVIGAAAAVLVATGALMAARGAGLGPWDDAGPRESVESPEPERSESPTPSEPPTTAPAVPSFEGTLDVDDQESLEQLFDFLREHEDDVVDLRLTGDLTPEEIIDTEPGSRDTSVEFHIDCTISVPECDQPSPQWQLAVLPDTDGQDGFDSVETVLEGSYLVRTVFTETLVWLEHVG